MSYFLNHILYIPNKCCTVVFVVWGFGNKRYHENLLDRKQNPFKSLLSRKLWNADLRTFSWLKQLMNSRSTGLARISGMFAILVKCCDYIVWCVAQPHLRPAAFSVQPEITTAVCSSGFVLRVTLPLGGVDSVWIPRGDQADCLR